MSFLRFHSVIDSFLEVWFVRHTLQAYILQVLCLNCMEFSDVHIYQLIQLMTHISLHSRFYLFACARCNHGVEFLRRLHMNIEEVVHLLLFNLTLRFRKRYYNLTNVIYPYARDNWHALQLPPKVCHRNSIRQMTFPKHSFPFHCHK